jgi:Zn-dependent protease
LNFSRLNSFLNWQVRICNLFGIPIYLHITLVFFLWPALRGGGFGFWYSVEFAVLLVLSILFHELGHALTAKHFRLTRLSITLHGFGGFASSSGWGNPRQDLLITLAGPAVTFVVGILCTFIGSNGLHQAMAYDSSTIQFILIRSLGILNIVMGFLNLIPVLPFDGGNALRAILTFRLSPLKALRAVAHLGLILTPVMIVYGIISKADFLLIFGVISLVTSIATLVQSGGIRMGEVFADRRARKEDEAAARRRKEKNEAFVADVHARQREREEQERLRKLLGED